MTTEPPEPPPAQPPAPGGYPPGGYAAPGTDDPGWGGQYPPAPPPRTGLSTGVKVGIGVGVLAGIVVVLGIIGLVLDVAGSHKHLSTPTVLADAPMIDDSNFTTIAQRVSQQISGSGGHHAVVAFYGTASHPSFLLAGADSSAFGDPNHAVDDLLKGFTSGASSAQIGAASVFPAGSRGGTVRCGTFTIATTSGSYCGFSDHSVAGIVLSFNLSTAQAASELTNRVRLEAEK